MFIYHWTKSFIRFSCHKHAATRFTFFKYKKDVISTTDENFGSPSSNLRTDNTKNVLKLRDTIITKKLKRLNNKIFALPMNKTKNNVSFLYQRHYPETLVNELDFNNVINIASIGLEVIKPVVQVILDNTSSVKNKVNLELIDIIENLP